MSLISRLRSRFISEEPSSEPPGIYPAIELGGVELIIHAYRFDTQPNPMQPANALYLDAELHGDRTEHMITNPHTIESAVEQLETALGREIDAPITSD